MLATSVAPSLDRSAVHLTVLLAVLSGLAAVSPAQGPRVDFLPVGKEVVLNTENGGVLTSVGWVPVQGGVYVFRHIRIPAGTTVRGAGKNPLILVAARDVQVDGTITVRGGDGGHGPDPNGKIPAAAVPGGQAHCGGGNGGRGSPSTTRRTLTGESGFGPNQLPGFGGRGGVLNCAKAVCGIGSAGGGGTFGSVGDTNYKLKSVLIFVQPKGVGGFGCSGGHGSNSRSLAGGQPGDAVFVDADPRNDFFGIGYDVHRRRFVLGELPVLAGGSGGGGGGDEARSCALVDPNFIHDDRGGGGGAGGGCLVIVAEGGIAIGGSGKIVADGGDGGGGGWIGSSNRAGGGGGGSGGMVVLYSRRAIDITVHGETYANNDYDFAISADGGVGRLVPYSGGGSVRGKYPPTSVRNMNSNPSGGFGGMGVIQLMAPPINPVPDGTNTILDDNIHIRGPGGQLLRGAEKQRYLAWRGFPDARGVWVDDQGRATKIGDDEGDIRPSPVLLPVF